MKNSIIQPLKILIISALLSALLIAGGCTNPDGNASSDTLPVSAETDVSTDEQKDFDISSLHSYDAENGDSFAGVWQITDGAGSKYSNFIYLFDGKGEASLVIGNIGYIGTYDIEKDAQIGAQVFSCKLMFGINGDYTYEFSDSDNTVVLKNTSSGDTTTLSRIKEYSFVPVAESNPEIDSDIIGAWMSDNGIYRWFGGDGIMYVNMYGTMFTYYNYTAKDGTVSGTYVMTDEITETYAYSYEDDKLTFDGIEYTKISKDELK